MVADLRSKLINGAKLICFEYLVLSVDSFCGDYFVNREDGGWRHLFYFVFCIIIWFNIMLIVPGVGNFTKA